MSATENYTEVTGNYTRVGVLAETEAEAVAFAEELMGGQSYAWTDQGRPEWNEWEVVFEKE